MLALDGVRSSNRNLISMRLRSESTVRFEVNLFRFGCPRTADQIARINPSHPVPISRFRAVEFVVVILPWLRSVGVFGVAHLPRSLCCAAWIKERRHLESRKCCYCQMFLFHRWAQSFTDFPTTIFDGWSLKALLIHCLSSLEYRINIARRKLYSLADSTHFTTYRTVMDDTVMSFIFGIRRPSSPRGYSKPENLLSLYKITCNTKLLNVSTSFFVFLISIRSLKLLIWNMRILQTETIDTAVFDFKTKMLVLGSFHNFPNGNQMQIIHHSY